MGEPVHGEAGEVANGGGGLEGGGVRLEMQAVFDLETGFLIVGKGPRLGEDSLGARGFGGEGYEVRPKRVLNKGTAGGGEPPPGFFYPKEGDRILALNYESFKVPTAWLGKLPSRGAGISSGCGASCAAAGLVAVRMRTPQ